MRTLIPIIPPAHRVQHHNNTDPRHIRPSQRVPRSLRQPTKPIREMEVKITKRFLTHDQVKYYRRSVNKVEVHNVVEQRHPSKDHERIQEAQVNLLHPR